MNFLPFDSKTNRIVLGNGLDRNFPAMVTIPYSNFPRKGTIPYLEVLEEPAFTRGEEWILRKEREAFTFVYYCDSVSGGKDRSGTGTKEDPFRSLAHIMKILFCRRDLVGRFLGYTGMCIKIFLKGVVDYDFGFFTSYYDCCREPIFIISKWEDEGGSEAIIQDQNGFAPRFIVFQGITFKDLGELDATDCLFENCDFSGNFWTGFRSGSDYYRCRIVPGKDREIYDIWLWGRYFKECRIEFSSCGEDVNWNGDHYWLCYLVQDVAADCEVIVKGENIFDAPDSRYDLNMLYLTGDFQNTNFDIQISDPLPKKREDRSSRRICGVYSHHYENMMDCSIHISAEYNFAPPYDENDTWKPQLSVHGANGYGNHIRSSVKNKGVSVNNGTGVFSGFFGDLNLIDCTVSD